MVLEALGEMFFVVPSKKMMLKKEKIGAPLENMISTLFVEMLMLKTRRLISRMMLKKCMLCDIMVLRNGGDNNA